MSHRDTNRRPHDQQRSGQRSQSANVSRVLDPNAPAFVPATAQQPQPPPPPPPTQQQFQGPFQHHGQMPMGQPQYPAQMGQPQYPAQMGQHVRYMPMNLTSGGPPVFPQQPGHFPHPQMAPPNMLPMPHPGMFQPFTGPYAPPVREIQRQGVSGVPQQRQQSVPPPRRQVPMTQQQPSMNTNVSLHVQSNVPQSHPQSNVTFGGFGGTNIENQASADEPDLDFNEIVKRIHEGTPLPEKLTNNSDEMWSLVRLMAKNVMVLETRHKGHQNRYAKLLSKAQANRLLMNEVAVPPQYSDNVPDEVLVAKTADYGDDKLKSVSTHNEKPSSSAASLVSRTNKNENAIVQIIKEFKSVSLSVTDGSPSTRSLSAPVQSSKLSKEKSAKTTEKVILEQRISEKPSIVIPSSKAKNVDTKSEAGINNNGSARKKQPTFNEVVQAKFSKYCSSMPKFRNNYEDSNIELFNKITEHVYSENLTESQDIKGIIENSRLRMNYYNDRGDPEKRNMHLMLEQFSRLAEYHKIPIIRQDMMFLFGVDRDRQEQAEVEMSYRDMILSMPDAAADTKGSGVQNTEKDIVVLETTGKPNALPPPSESTEVEPQSKTAENSMREQSISEQLEVSTVSEDSKTKSSDTESRAAKKKSAKKSKAKSANNSKQTKDDFDLDEYNNQQAAFDDVFFARLVPYFLTMFEARDDHIVHNTVVPKLFDQITDYIWTNNLMFVNNDNLKSIEEFFNRRRDSYGDKGDTESLGMKNVLTYLYGFRFVRLISQDLMFLFGVKRDKREQGKVEKEYRDMVLQTPIELDEEVADAESKPEEHSDSSIVKQHGEKQPAIATNSNIKQSKSAGYAGDKTEQTKHYALLVSKFEIYCDWFPDNRCGKLYETNPTHEIFRKISDYVWEKDLIEGNDIDLLAAPFKLRFAFYSQQKNPELRKVYNMFMLLAIKGWGQSILLICQDMQYLFGIARPHKVQMELEAAYLDMITRVIHPVAVLREIPPPGFPSTPQRDSPKPQEVPPKTPAVALKPKGVPPKAQRVPPKGQEVRPQSQGFPTKPQDVPPKAQGVSPKDQRVPLKPQGASPKPKGIPPKPQDVTPKAQGVSPKGQRVPPKPQGASPKSKGIPPKPQKAPPKPQEASPKSKGDLPK